MAQSKRNNAYNGFQALNRSEILEVIGVGDLAGSPLALVRGIVDHRCKPLALVLGVSLEWPAIQVNM